MTTTFKSRGRDYGFSANIYLITGELKSIMGGCKQDNEAIARIIVLSPQGNLTLGSGETISWEQGEGWERTISVQTSPLASGLG